MLLPDNLRRQLLTIAEQQWNVEEFEKSDVAEYIPPLLEEWKSSENPTQTELSDLMNSFESGHISFTGPAGSGKTTLLKMTARKVTEGLFENLKDVVLVIFIEQCLLHRSKISGKKLIFHALESKMDSQAVKTVEAYISDNPEKALFLLDSLDTLGFSALKPSDEISMKRTAHPHAHIANLLAGKYLKGCRIITSGRENAVKSLRAKVMPAKLINLTGLSQDAIRSITARRTGGILGPNILRSLEDDCPSLISLFSSPACLWYSLCVVDDWEGNDLCTMTQVLALVLLKLQHSRDLPSGGFSRLQAFSFSGLNEGKTNFVADELEEANLQEDFVEKLSIETPWESKMQVMRYDGTYFFTHQSLQEMFAAIHVAKSHPTAFHKFRSQKMNSPKFSNVRKLLYGLLFRVQDGEKFKLLQDENLDEKRRSLLGDIESLLEKAKHDGSSAKLLEIFRCLYEAGPAMKEIIRSRVHEVELKNEALSAGDAYVIGWIMSQCSFLEHVTFRTCLLTYETLENLNKPLKNGQTKVLTIAFHDNNFEPRALKTVGSISTNCSADGLTLENCGISASHIKNLGKNLLKIGNVILWDNKQATKEDVQAATELFPKVTKYVGLDNWNITEESRQVIQESLNRLTPAKKSLKVNIYPQGVLEREEETVGRDLKRKADTRGEVPLKRMKLSEKRMCLKRGKTKVSSKDKEVDRRIEAFLKNHDAQAFELSHIPLKDGKLTKLADALATKRKVRLLKLRACLEENTLCKLCGRLHGIKAPEIEEMNISGNRKIGIEQSSAAGKLVQTFKSSALDISQCDFSTKEMTSLERSITTAKLTKVKFNQNRDVHVKTIGSLGRMTATSNVSELHLVECKLRNCHLQELERYVGKSALKVLNLRFNKSMSIKGFHTIGRIAEKSPIVELMLAGCGVGEKEARSLQSGLGLKKLLSIDLSYNSDCPEVEELGTKDVSAFGRLAVSTCLEKLSLDGSRLNYTRMRALEEQLVKSELKILSLNSNPELDIHGLKLLGKSSKWSLDRLEVMDCCLATDDLKYFVDMLKRSKVKVIKVDRSREISSIDQLLQFTAYEFGEEEKVKLEKFAGKS